MDIGGLMKRLSSLIFRILAVAVFAISLTMVFHPDVRSSIRSIFVSDQRTVLSTAKGVFNSDEGEFSFIKIRTRHGIFVEVYRNNNSSSATLVDRIELLKHKDAFFTFNGQATNLAIDDIDGDNLPELLVPSFDSQLVAHLSVYKYNIGSHRFESESPSSF